MLAVLGATLAWCVGKFTDDTYASQASKIVNTTTSQLSELESSVRPDEERCAQGAFAACDRVMSAVSAMADEVSAAHFKLNTLSPPDEARAWHGEYVSFLGDLEATLRTMVSDWDSGNFSGVLAALGRLDSLSATEDRLTNYFNGHLR